MSRPESSDQRQAGALLGPDRDVGHATVGVEADLAADGAARVATARDDIAWARREMIIAADDPEASAATMRFAL